MIRAATRRNLASMIDFLTLAWLDTILIAGSFVAFGSICITQFVQIHRYRTQLGATKKQFDAELESLSSQLQAAHREQSLASLESDLLIELAGESRFDDGAGRLLRRYISNPRSALALIIDFGTNGQRIIHSRGVHRNTRNQFVIDDKLKERLTYERSISLQGNSLYDTELMQSLDRVDRDKVRELHLIAIGEPGELLGVFATSQLYPAGLPKPRQLALAIRLMDVASGTLARNLDFTTSEHQLQSAQEVLELREVTDAEYKTPGDLIDAFLTRLADIIGVERTTLFLAQHDSPHPLENVIRNGARLQAGEEAKWFELEDHLNARLPSHDLAILDADQLRQLGIESLIRTAISLPLNCDGEHVATVLLTSHASKRIAGSRIALLRWSAEHLAESIRQIVRQGEIERQATVDGLTGLANRRMFDRHLEEAIDFAKRNNQECALLLLDLDRFKSINDSYGHQAGDAVLQTTAEIIRQQVAATYGLEESLIARYGGEELAIVLSATGLPNALHVGEAVRAAVDAADFRFRDQTIPVTISIGVAAFPEQAGSKTELIATADAGLYEAKSMGRNMVRSVIVSAV